MTIETETVRSTARFVEREPRSSFSSTLRETFKINERCVVTPGIVVRETFYAQDHYVHSAFSVLHEKAYFRDAVYQTLKYSVATRDKFYVNDYISGSNRAHVDVRESARIFGRAISAPTASLHETFRVNDHIHWYSTGTVALRETFRVRDKAYPHTSVVLREKAYFKDTISRNVRAIVTVHEVFRANDHIYPHRIVRGDGSSLHDIFYIGDAVSTRVRGSAGAPLRETFYADDRALPPALGRAYGCSIIAWAMSTYQNYPFTTQAAGYAAGQNLWRLDAVDDYGKPIASWITTGRLDIGTSHGKRPTALYAAGSSLEPLTVTVTADVDGVLKSFDYTLELRDQTNYRNNKAILGKGFRSRYLQFRLSAVKYTGFRLLTAEVDLAASPRRVG